MILVTLGTQKQSFIRLLEYIENSSLSKNDKIVVQAGYTKFTSNKMQIFDFISYDEMDNLINKSDLVITHAGTGSILTPLMKNKKIIVCSRLSKYNEHVDDHQLEIQEFFYEQNYVKKIDEITCLDKVLTDIKYFTPSVYKSNNKEFVLNIKKIIDNY